VIRSHRAYYEGGVGYYDISSRRPIASKGIPFLSETNTHCPSTRTAWTEQDGGVAHPSPAQSSAEVLAENQYVNQTPILEKTLRIVSFTPVPEPRLHATVVVARKRLAKHDGSVFQPLRPSAESRVLDGEAPVAPEAKDEFPHHLKNMQFTCVHTHLLSCTKQRRCRYMKYYNIYY
jgi:hypothetical protein